MHHNPNFKFNSQKTSKISIESSVDTTQSSTKILNQYSPNPNQSIKMPSRSPSTAVNNNLQRFPNRVSFTKGTQNIHSLYNLIISNKETGLKSCNQTSLRSNSFKRLYKPKSLAKVFFNTQNVTLRSQAGS